MDDIFDSIGKNTESINRGILPAVFLYTNSPLATPTAKISRLEIFPGKKIFQQRPTQMHTAKNPDFSVTYRECFNITFKIKTKLLLKKNHHALKIQ